MIRKAELGDTFDIKEVHSSAIRRLCSPYYSPAQIDAWANWKEEYIFEAIQKCPHFVVNCSGKRVTGFASLRPDLSIWHVYVHPDYTLRGFGQELLKDLENYVSLQGKKDSILESSLNASDFYIKQGYKKTGESIVIINEEKIDVISMEKELFRK